MGRRRGKAGKPKLSGINTGAGLTLDDRAGCVPAFVFGLVRMLAIGNPVSGHKSSSHRSLEVSGHWARGHHCMTFTRSTGRRSSLLQVGKCQSSIPV